MSSSFDLSVGRLLRGQDRLIDPGLAGHNRTERPLTSETAVAQIERATRRRPDSVAVRHWMRTVTYDELWSDASEVVALLGRGGVGRGNVVGIDLPPSPTRLAAVLGVLRAGAAYLPLDPDLPAVRARQQVDDAAARGVLVAEGDALRLEGGASSSTPPRTGGPAAGSPAYVIFTSGSTGRPKGVMIAHRSLVNRLEWMARALAISSDDRVLHKTAFGFDVSVWEQLLPLTLGAQIVVAAADERGDAHALARLFEEQSVTVTHFVPSMLAAFVDSGGFEGASALRTVVSSGEALPVSLARDLAAATDATLYNLYGPTEATIDVTSWRFDPHDDRPFVPLGHPIDNTTLHVLNSRLRPVPVGERGELCIGGVGVAAGYIARGDLTAAAFMPDPWGPPGARLYRTGDLVRLHPDGLLEYLGRADSQVKIRGFRIEPGEIEHHLVADDRVVSAAVVAHTDDARGSTLVAHVVPARDWADEDKAAVLRAMLGAALPPQMVPAAFLFHDAMPLTSSGKIDRRALPPPTYRDEAEWVQPQSSTEVLVAEVWADVLGIDDVGVNDNFFQVGGDSISAIRVVARALHAGLQFEVRDVMESPTVAELAELADERATVGTGRQAAPERPPALVVHDEDGVAPVLLTMRLHRPRGVTDVTSALGASLARLLGTEPEVAREAAGGPPLCDRSREWWDRRPLDADPIAAVVFTADDGLASAVTVGCRAAMGDRSTLELLARDAASRIATGAGALPAAVAVEDVIAATTAPTRDDQTWAAARVQTDRRGRPTRSQEVDWPPPLPSHSSERAVAQAAVLAALREVGVSDATVVLASDREWAAQTGWDVEATLGRLDTRRRTNVAITGTLWDLARTVKRRARGLDGDDLDETAFEVEIEWFETIDDDLWAEVRDGGRSATALSGRTGVSVEFVASADVLTVRWSADGRVDDEMIATLSAAFERVLTDVAASPVASSRVAADVSDHPLAGLDAAGVERLAGIDMVDCYPLSPMQEGLLVRALFWPGSDAYHNQNVLELRGPLDADRLERSWATVASRYEMLRTGFAWDGLQHPVQFVAPPSAHRFERRSWTGDTEAQFDAQLDALLDADRERPFDLRQPGLYRIYLVEVEPDVNLLVWSHHHLLLDGWCLSLIWGDVFSCYARDDLAPPARRFRDYVRWLRDKQVTDDDLTFWRTTLAELDVPSNVSPHGAEREGAFETRRVRATAERTAALTRLAHRCRVTPNVVVQAAWSLLVSVRTSQSDVVHGVSISGRPPELEGVETMVGLFINSIPLRLRIDPAATIAELLGQAQLELARASARGHVPLAEILACWPERSANRRLFDSLVAFESYPEDNLPSGSVDGVEVIDRFALEKTEYPLGMIVLPGERIEFHWNYDTSHFADDEIEDLIATFEMLLDSMTGDPDARVGTLTLLTTSGRQRLERWSHGARRERQALSLYDGFANQARETPAARALVDGDAAWTYEQLERSAREVAGGLAAMGVRAGDAVVVAVERSSGWVRAVLGVHALGAIPVLVDANQPVSFVAGIAAAAGAYAAVLDATSTPLEPHFLRTVRIDRPVSGTPMRGPAHPVAAVVHTSGSTGEPKAILCSQDGYVNRVEWSLRAQRPNGPLRLLLNAGTSFDIVLWELYAPLFAGGTVVVPAAHALDAAALVAAVEEHDVSVLHLIPGVLAEFLSDPDVAGCDSLDVVVTGGATVPPSLVGQFMQSGLTARLHQAYGPSEASISVTDRVLRPDDAQTSFVPLGRPIDNCSCLVLDDQLRMLPVGSEGDLYLAGDALAIGYLGRPAETAREFVPDPFSDGGRRMYRTGDRARWTRGGTLELRGRRDLQVKIRGQRIQLGAVEAALASRPAARESVAIARTRDSGEIVLEAVVEESTGERWTADGVRSWMSARVPSAMVPSVIHMVDTLPRTKAGKVDRRQIEATVQPATLAPAVSRPFTEMETVVAGAWAAELDLDHVDLDADVYDLGATSLSVMRVFARLKRVLPAGAGVEIPHLFKATTPARLAELVLAPVAGSGSDHVVVICDGTTGPPVFLVHPVQGVTSAYHALRGPLGDLEICAFNDPRLDADAGFGSIEEMAAVYVEWVRALSGGRAPVVGGWSFGGGVALEMARQMGAHDDAPARVLLIDSSPLAGVADVDGDGGGRPATGGSPILAAAVERNASLTRGRIEQPYDGPVVLLRAASTDLGPRNGWRTDVLPSLDVVTIAGGHHDLFTDAHVESTAFAIRSAVLGAEA
ncbi:MAG: amino acid adenylation domain-containing protein [bacterium]|nr:amino acid adenylation domain-containing protein [bacterium]